MLSDAEFGLVRSFEQGSVVSCPFPTTTSAFYHYASTIPDTTALRDMASSPPQDVSYRELARRVQKLATKLRELGVGPGKRLPLVVRRGPEMIVGILAILSVGAQYVPLDGGIVPDSTIRVVVEQSNGDVALCLSSTERKLRDVKPDLTLVRIEDYCAKEEEVLVEDVIDLATPEGGCYVIYTSGTTGKPKGVDVTHRNVANLVCQAPGNLDVRPGVKVGSVLNISFDMAAWEIFTCLCNGGTLVLRGSQWEPTLEQINVLICTPTILSRYQPSRYPQIKTVATAGEPSTQGLADLWATHATYWNCCGPTETTIVNTMSRHVVGAPLSIGKPTPNNIVYILDDDLNRVPADTPGAMWAGGLGVSRGYVGLEAQTAENYLEDKFADDGTKIYKTGDLGQWKPDGSIEILGRADDQVKIKGFRVELDGIAATIASFAGISRATTLLIDGQLIGFAQPAHHDSSAVLEFMKKYQPYYAVPSKLHFLSQLPTTANGKIDKQALRLIVTRPETIDEKYERRLPEKYIIDPESLVETRSIYSSTTSTVTDNKDLTSEIPEKKRGQPWRGLRYRILILYRQLFSIVWLINIGALIALVLTQGGSYWLGLITAINLTACILIRQELVINVLYTIFCSVPRSLPLWIRSRCAEIYHLGGIHSAAGICATIWLLISTIRSTIELYNAKVQLSPNALATIAISWLLCLLCCVLVGFAYPAFRKKYHNNFEYIHRFVGWITLGLFWVRTMLSIDGERTKQLGLAAVESPVFWLLIVSTVSIASSWFFLRKVPVNAEVLSDHAIRLHFDYTVPVNGSFTRISRRPLLEWHSFATIAQPKPKGNGGYSVVVSNAGDWTKSCIQNPPTKLWVRGLPTCGVMRVGTLFNRLVIIATGSGVGPVLGHITNPSCPTQLIWSASNPEKTFGREIVDSIRKTNPDAVIHNTKTQGRPDLVKMGYNMVQNFGAEAVIIIANEKITKKVVYGLQTRGVPAYGAIWDS